MRSDTSLDSISESARRVEYKIVNLGVKNQLFIRKDQRQPNKYPLIKVQFTRNLLPQVIDSLRTDLNGNGGGPRS